MTCIIDVSFPLSALPKSIVDTIECQRGKEAVILDFLLTVVGQLDQGDNLGHVDPLLGQSVDIVDVPLGAPW